jgi:hypothetical protein
MPNPSAPRATTTTERLTIVERDVHSLRDDIHRIAHRLEAISQENSHSLKKLTEEIANRGKTSPQTILGVIAALAIWSGILSTLIWTVVDLNNQPMEVRFEEFEKNYIEHKTNHGHPVLMQEMASMSSTITAMDKATEYQDQRLERLETWYNGHGQEMAAKIAVNDEMMMNHEQDVHRLYELVLAIVQNRFMPEDARDLRMDIQRELDQLRSREQQ